MFELEFSCEQRLFGAETGTVPGFTDINSDDQKLFGLYIGFTQTGISAIIFKSHGCTPPGWDDCMELKKILIEVFP